MSDNNTTSSLEKIGYFKTLPKNSDINEYESISVKNTNGESIVLYRFIETKTEFDDTSNFSSSLEVFNSFL
jgi:hypothetical protein